MNCRCDDCQYGDKRVQWGGFSTPICDRHSSVEHPCFVPSGCLVIFEEVRL